MDAYEFSGQIAAATASQGFSASVTWQQQGRLSELSLRSPLGLGGARVNFDGANLRVTASDGSKVEGEAARAQMVQMVGFEPPLSSLRYWLLGVPDPASEASETLDEVQRLKSLEQNGWFIDYGEYAASSTLPTRMTLHRQALKLKLHITRWRVP